MERLGLYRVEEQAAHLGLHRAQVYRVLAGDTIPGEKFIAACMAVYDGKFETLFEIAEAA